MYSILIVSSSESFHSALTPLLPEAVYDPVCFVPSISQARQAAAERDFDFIIINSPLPDDPGIRFSIDLCTEKGTVVLMLLRAEFYEDIHAKVSGHGVFTLSKPLSRQTLLKGLDWMTSTRERLRKFEKKNLSIEEKMGEIRIVNQAKWILINQLHMDEPQAHRYLVKQAMDRCISKKTVAEEIIKTYS